MLPKSSWKTTVLKRWRGMGIHCESELSNHRKRRNQRQNLSLPAFDGKRELHVGRECDVIGEWTGKGEPHSLPRFDVSQDGKTRQELRLLMNWLCGMSSKDFSYFKLASCGVKDYLKQLRLKIGMSNLWLSHPDRAPESTCHSPYQTTTPKVHDISSSANPLLSARKSRRRSLTSSQPEISLFPDFCLMLFCKFSLFFKLGPQMPVNVH